MSDTRDTPALATSSHHPNNGPTVRIETGAISGIHLPGGVRAFLGIPYAAPPVGALRWRPTQPPKPWSSTSTSGIIRPADRFGPSAMQFPPPDTSLYSNRRETEFSEDCLYLNVWTGDGEGQSGRKRPVLVFFHMGAFMFGSGSNPMYDGTRFASAEEDGITVVTVNYRLGRFGFLAHPELTGEGASSSSGNYGIMDQISALQWVQRNIAVFGGDPDNVTIAGASAGGASVHILRTSPLARGLFHKVIHESGTALAPMLPGQNKGHGHGHVASLMTLADAEAAGKELVSKVLGCESIEQLRSLSPEEILAAQLPRMGGPWKSPLWPQFQTSLSLFDTCMPIVDGHVVPVEPLAALLSSSGTEIPMLAGNSGNEACGLPYLGSLAEYRAFREETFGGNGNNGNNGNGDIDFVAEALKVYPASNDTEVRTATTELLADWCFVWPTWTAARIQASAAAAAAAASSGSAPVYYYSFLHHPPIPPRGDIIEGTTDVGAFHLAGVLYAFGNLEGWMPEWEWTEEDRRISASVRRAWATFMRTGNPIAASTGVNGSGNEEVFGEGGGEGGPSWPVLTLGQVDAQVGADSVAGPLIRIWDAQGPRLGRPLSRLGEVAAFWDSVYGIQIPSGNL